jgi:DNA-binding MarR family transcriptional regulator
MIKTSLITFPLPDSQKRTLVALGELPRPSTCGEVARQVAARTGRKCEGLSGVLSALVARGLVKRQRVGRLWLYSRTEVTR